MYGTIATNRNSETSKHSFSHFCFLKKKGLISFFCLKHSRVLHFIWINWMGHPTIPLNRKLREIDETRPTLRLPVTDDNLSLQIVYLLDNFINVNFIYPPLGMCMWNIKPPYYHVWKLSSKHQLLFYSFCTFSTIYCRCWLVFSRAWWFCNYLRRKRLL